MEGKYYLVDEVASRLGVHVKTIRRYISAGKLQALKVGGQWRIYENALKDYYEQSKHCCGDDTISQDDFCVFMDGNHFLTDKKIQICTIIDYYVKSQTEVKPMVDDITEVLMSLDDSGSHRFNYTFDHIEGKARFVIWGLPGLIEKIAARLKQFE